MRAANQLAQDSSTGTASGPGVHSQRANLSASSPVSPPNSSASGPPSAGTARTLPRRAGTAVADQRDPARPPLHVVLALADGEAAAAAVEHPLRDRRGEVAHELRMVWQHQAARTGLETDGRVLHPRVEAELL